MSKIILLIEFFFVCVLWAQKGFAETVIDALHLLL